MVKNRKLSRAISKTRLENIQNIFRTDLRKKYGRDFRVISRWEPTSQICSCCGFKGGKLDLSIRGECLNFGAKNDRDENAARNIFAGGHIETLNGLGGKHKTTVKVAAACDMSTRRRAKAW